MNTGPLIESALAGLTFNSKAVNTYHAIYTGTDKVYIRYYVSLDTNNYFADDTAVGGNVFDTVDIFCNKSDYSSLRDDVETRLTAAGFTVGDAGPELYETSSGLWHLPINISYEK